MKYQIRNIYLSKCQQVDKIEITNVPVYINYDESKNVGVGRIYTHDDNLVADLFLNHPPKGNFYPAILQCQTKQKQMYLAVTLIAEESYLKDDRHVQLIEIKV